MQHPLVSIIIPTFNREHLIGKALDSVIAQTYIHWECIIVDDGSSDGTLDVLKTYVKQDSRIKFYKRQRSPKGAPTSRNIGLDHAKGDYIIFLDSDDYLLSFCLEQRVQAFKINSDCDFLVFPMAEFRHDAIIDLKIPDSSNYLINFLSAVLPWSIMCPIWDIKFLKQLKGFTEGYPRFNDPELMIRALLQNNVKFKVVTTALSDSVYLPSYKEQFVFINSVFNSLLLFIPDIVKELDMKGKANFKPHLALYLHLWFIYFYVPSGQRTIKQSMQLIFMFKKQNIITTYKAINLNLRLLIYALSITIFKKPINKLTYKGLYL